MYLLSGHDQVRRLRKIQAGLCSQEVTSVTSRVAPHNKLLANVASPHVLYSSLLLLLLLPLPSSSSPPPLSILRCPNMAVQVAEECEEEDVDVAEDGSDLEQVVSHMLHFVCVSSGC